MSVVQSLEVAVIDDTKHGLLGVIVINVIKLEKLVAAIKGEAAKGGFMVVPALLAHNILLESHRQVDVDVGHT